MLFMAHFEGHFKGHIRGLTLEYTCDEKRNKLMSLNEKIEKQKAMLIDKHIERYKTTGVGLSKALKLMYLEIQKMRDDKLSLSEQINILNGIFDIFIKYDTYKKWSSRTFGTTKKSTEIQAPKVEEPKEKTTLKKQVAHNENEPTTKIKKSNKKIHHDPVANLDELI